MQLLGSIIAIVVAVLGAVWMLQGLNVIGGSFMTGQPTWSYIGAICVVAGLGALWWLRRS